MLLCNVFVFKVHYDCRKPSLRKKKSYDYTVGGDRNEEVKMWMMMMMMIMIMVTFVILKTMFASIMAVVVGNVGNIVMMMVTV